MDKFYEVAIDVMTRQVESPILLLYYIIFQLYIGRLKQLHELLFERCLCEKRARGRYFEKYTVRFRF